MKAFTITIAKKGNRIVIAKRENLPTDIKEWQEAWHPVFLSMKNRLSEYHYNALATLATKDLNKVFKAQAKKDGVKIA